MSGGGSSTTDYEELSYDAASNVTDRRLRNGASIGYGYDRLNRLTGKTLPPGSGNPIPSYSYDLVGNMISASNAHPTLPYSNGTSFTWDALGRRIGETSSYNGTNLIVKAMEYDLAGRQTKFSWPGELYVTYEYNDANDLKMIKENGSTMLFTFTYDDLGRRLTKDTLNNNNMVYAYDPASRLTYWQNNGGGTGTEVTLGGYSPAGEIGSRVSTNAAYAAAKPQDGTTSYTPNGLNQYGAISSTAPITVEYDLKQNMSKFGSKTASFGAENMITTGGPSSYWHDALNRITYLTQKGLRFDNEGSNLVGIYSGATLLRRYIYEPGATAPILWYEGTGTSDRRFMDADERGSIVRVSNNAGGTMRINSYDEYGVPGANNLGRFGYTGHIWLPEAGMYYARNRMYEPKLGRFMQTDPIGYDDGMNIYAYVRNDPVNFVDPTGLICIATRIGGDGRGTTCLEDAFNEDTGQIGSNPSGPNSAGNKPTKPGYHYFRLLTKADDDEITVTAIKLVSDSKKYVLVGGHYYLNPYYNPPLEITLDQAIGGSALAGIGAGLASIVYAGTAVEGAQVGYRLYGVGRFGQVRFGKDALIIRLDVNKPITHLNIQGNLFGRTFNFHIPRF